MPTHSFTDDIHSISVFTPVKSLMLALFSVILKSSKAF